MDYTPYEGFDVTGWPRTVLSRGRVVVENEELHVERGSGEFLKRTTQVPTDKTVRSSLAPELNFGADLAR
jgi:dihydropyrimidinase